MVLLHVKRGDESQFLLQAPGSTELEELTVQVARVYNGRLKVQRLCSGAARGRARPRTDRETGVGWRKRGRLGREVRFVKIIEEICSSQG
ncbi:Cilia- and flagella-associated protein 298 [Plecturocebus cupreus]